jgi:hypothetical protein
MANGEDEMKKAGKRVAGKAREESSSRKGSAQQKELQRKGKANTETKARRRKAPFVL